MMETFTWIIGFVLLFIGTYLMFFPARFLSYDSRRLPNFWDNHGARDIVLLNWKSRRAITLALGIIFLIGGVVIFLSIYLAYHARLA